MSNSVGRVGTAAPPVNFATAAAAALYAQDAPAQAPPAARGDSSKVRTAGSAATNVSLNNRAQETVYVDEKGNKFTQAQINEMEREARMERRVGNAIGGTVTIGFGISTGISALKAVNAARTAATAVNATATVAKGASLFSKVAGKALPGIGIVTGVIGIGAGVANWNSEGNTRKADDVARIAGDALTVAGSALMLTGVGAPIGLGLAAAGLIISGIGMLFDDQ